MKTVSLMKRRPLRIRIRRPLRGPSRLVLAQEWGRAQVAADWGEMGRWLWRLWAMGQKETASKDSSCCCVFFLLPLIFWGYPGFLTHSQAMAQAWVPKNTLLVKGNKNPKGPAEAFSSKTLIKEEEEVTTVQQQLRLQKRTKRENMQAVFFSAINYKKICWA